MTELNFNNDFVLGVATAAYQIEGGAKDGGRGPSIWDEFSHVKGKTYNGETGDIACDSYHKYKEDIAIIQELGIKYYRLSLSWSRIFPKDDKTPNPKGVEYYHNVFKVLKDNGITPYVTLYHWDLPLYLGDWTKRKVAYAFESYAKFCFNEFKDEVSNWITLNEPLCSSFVSHFEGRHAPGHTDLNEAFIAAHYLNLAHGLAVKAFRESKINGRIGITINPVYPQAASSNEEDKKAAELVKQAQTDVFIKPIICGVYPPLIKEILDIDMPIEKNDLLIINQKIDFLGVNYYSENLVKWDDSAPLKFKIVRSWQPISEMGWPIVPKGLLRYLKTITEDTNGIDLYITENGIAVDDQIIDGSVHDLERINYLKAHLLICQEAIEKGIPLKGYFAWSLLDNFEWAHGYSKRFGITYVDYKNNNKRIIKDSGYFLRDVNLGLI